MDAYVCKSCGAVTETGNVVRAYGQAGGALCGRCASRMEQKEITAEELDTRKAAIRKRSREERAYLAAEIVAAIAVCVGIWLYYQR